MRHHGLDLNLVAVLDGLFTHRSVSRVADDLCLTPSSISNALSRLRQHFGDDLFIVLGREMTPTPFAESLRDPVQAMLRHASGLALTRAAFDPARSTQTFQIAASDFALHVLAGDLVRRLAETAPDVSLVLLPLTGETMERFQRGHIDLLVAPEGVVEPTPQSCGLFEDRFVPVAWNGNRALTEPLSREGLFRRAARPGGTSQRRSYRSARPVLRRRPAAADRRPGVELSRALDLVVGTLSIATLPELLTRKYPGSGALRVLTPAFALPVIHERLYWVRLPRDRPGQSLAPRFDPHHRARHRPHRFSPEGAGDKTKSSPHLYQLLFGVLPRHSSENTIGGRDTMGSGADADAEARPDAGARLATAVERITDIAFAAPDGRVLLADLYRPIGLSGALPVVVWLHGGGFRIGDRKLAPDLERFFARHGFAMLSIDYRLSGEAVFPPRSRT